MSVPLPPAWPVRGANLIRGTPVRSSVPTALFLKAAESSLSLLPQIGFIVTLIFGLIFGKAYNVAIGQDLYEHDAHSRLGWFVAVLACALSAHDVVKGAIQFREWYSGKSYHGFSGVPAEDGDSAERERFIVAEEEEMVESPAKEQPTDWGHVHFAEDRHARTMSMHSDDTVFDHSPRPLTPPSPAAPVTVASLRARVVALAPGLITVVDRSLLILGYTCALSGIAVYTGTCRERYLNGSAPSLPSSFPSRTQTDPPLRARFSCLAHTIKGLRLLLVRPPLVREVPRRVPGPGVGVEPSAAGLAGAKVWSAEAVEALVIFTYGITNVCELPLSITLSLVFAARGTDLVAKGMELFMGEGGSISVHQVQHAGVALM